MNPDERHDPKGKDGFATKKHKRHKRRQKNRVQFKATLVLVFFVSLVLLCGKNCFRFV
jgi:hypothetical protein